jgi:transmembrane sensor
MITMSSGANSDAEDEAACWQARLAASDCTGTDRARFEAWRTGSPANARASDAAARVDALLEELGAQDPQLLAMADEAFEQGSHLHVPRIRRWAVPAALAAGVVLVALLVGTSIETVLPRSESVAHFAASDSRRDFTLSDGSVVHLDIESEVSARVSDERRDIELVRGRALFEVAHDRSRPFVVSAGSARVLALGTQFQVSREAEVVRVVLTEGSVSVADMALPLWRETLRPGEEVAVSGSAEMRVKHAADVQVTTSWSRGRHIFRGTPLAQAVQEVNTYAARKVRLGDPSIASLAVGGNFVAGDSESVVAAFAAALPVRVVDAGSELILFRRYEADAH